MSDHAIDIAGLAHRFKEHQALREISFQVPARTIHGFVGPNGAGKTTTLRTIATLLVPDRGRVLVHGRDVVLEAAAVRRRLGWMPDHFSSYRRMTVAEYLDFFAAAYGLAPAERERTVGDVLALVDLGGRRDDLIGSLSRGMQQRLALARMLVHDPDLLLLDEPASGLDPRARIELMDVLRELKRLGKTVFISSHILSELGDLCDGVTILDRGAVRFSGGMADLLRAGGDDEQAWDLELAEPCPAALAALAALPGMRRCAADQERPATLHLALAADGTDGNTLLATAIAAGASIRGFRPGLRRLDAAFMALTSPGLPP